MSAQMAFAFLLICSLQRIWALDSDCKISKTDMFVHHWDSVMLTWSLDSAKISSSTGYIFGLVTYEPSASCKTKVQRVVTVPLATKKKTCPPSSGWESWCNNYTDVSLMTNANGSETFRITFPVESILKYNMTTNSTTLFNIRLHRNGPSGNGSELPVEYNVEIHILATNSSISLPSPTPSTESGEKSRKRPETSTTDPATATTNSSISLPSPTPSTESGEKSQMSGGLIALIANAVIGLLGLLFYCCYHYNNNFQRYCQQGLNLLPLEHD